MTAKFQKTPKKWLSFAVFSCLLPLTACMGSGTSFLEDTGFDDPVPAPQLAQEAKAPPAQLSEVPDSEVLTNERSSGDDALYSDLPIGPKNTGTYPDLRNEPKARIVTEPSEGVDVLTKQMTALADDHEKGRISTAAYQRRLTYLQALARNHSADMLAQIGEPAN